MRVHRVLLISIAFFFIIKLACKAECHKRMIIVTVNTLSAYELLKEEHMEKYAVNGIIGLLSIRSNDVDNQYKQYMTLGSGERAEAYFDCLEVNNVNEETASAYYSYTLNEPVSGNLISLYINRLKYINSRTFYNAQPGKLGDKLRANKYKTAFLGGFLYGGVIKSPGFFIAMDSSGIVDCGDINSVFDNKGIRTDKLLDSFKKIYNDGADFIVIELGDIETLYANKRLYTYDTYEAEKNKLLKKNGTIIDLIAQNIDFSNTTLCIISPFSKNDQKDSRSLSPLIIYDGGKSKGILASNTTRRDGICTGLDFAPYILNYFNIESDGFIGFPFKYKTLENNLDFIIGLDRKVTSVSTSRPFILKLYALCIIFALFLYSIWLLGFKKFNIAIIRFLMKLLMFVPFSMLIEGFICFYSTVEKLLFIFGLSLLCTLIFNKLYNSDNEFIYKAALTNALLLCFDLLSGQILLRYSVFSYDPIIGARFYGLGNEYLGILAVCALLISGYMLEKGYKKYLAVIFALFICAVIGFPMSGSNIGGLITVVLSFTVFWLLEFGYNINKAVMYGIVFSIISVAVVLILNFAFKAAGSHPERALEMVKFEGIHYFYMVISRKLSMAVRLIKYTIWSKVLIALVIASLIMALKPRGNIAKLYCNFPHIKNALISAVIGSFTAITCNDSGIVTAAGIMLYTVFSISIMSGLNNWE